MDRQFWITRWEQNRTSFHLEQPNPALVRHWDALHLSGDERVLVPLCGKSLDLSWLSERGHKVLGVELSSLAVEAFFAAMQLRPEHSRRGAFDVWEAGAIRILCGDFLSVDAQALAGVSAVYDRAALIALPSELRSQYAAVLRERVAAPVRMLLIALEYDQTEMEGPPFSVAEPEVRSLYGTAFEIEVLERKSAEVPPRFAEHGLTELVQTVYALKR